MPILLRQQRRVRPGRLRRLLALSVASAVLAGACLTPTQITVQITTNAVCIESTENALHLHDVGIIAGSPDAVRNGDHTPNAVTSDCGPPKGTIHKGYGPQEVGTMVIVPSGDKEVPARIVVVGRVAPLGQLQPDKTLDACILWAFTPATGPKDAKDPDFQACIVSRRNLTFIESTKLDLPIQLDTNCAGIVCDAESYCFDSRCVNANVDCNEQQPVCFSGEGGAGGSVASTTGGMTTGSMSSGSLSSGSVTGSSSDASSSTGMGGTGPTTASVGSSSSGMGGSGPATTVSVGSSSSGGMGGSGPATTVSVGSSSSGMGGSGPATTVSVGSSSSGGPAACTMVCGPGCACVMENVCECP